MHRPPIRPSMKALPFIALLPLLLLAAAGPAVARDVIDLGAPSAELIPVPTQVDLVSVARAEGESGGLDIVVRPGPVSYPGINFRLTPGTPDLSEYGYVEARVTNTGAKPLHITLRVDSVPAPELGLGSGSAFGRVLLPPGESGTARAYFAHPKKGASILSPRHLDMILIYLGKEEADVRSFRLDSITAGGRPGDKPAAPAPGK